MDSQKGKQYITGALVGLLISGAIWFLLGDKRDDLTGLKTSNEKLAVEVDKGKQLKASYEKLKKEVEEQEIRIAELIELFPAESERSRVAYRVQKLAAASALGQVQGWVNADKPIKNDYYMEYPTTYRYTGGFHEFGRFLSFVSGYDKIINISDMVMTRETVKSVNSASIEFRLSVYVFDAKAQAKPKASAKAASGAKPVDNEE